MRLTAFNRTNTDRSRLLVQFACLSRNVAAAKPQAKTNPVRLPTR